MTIKLSETQIAALKTGLTNDKGFIDFGKLNGGAQTKVTTALITKKLAGFRAGNLVITTQGRQAAGAAPRETKPPSLKAEMKANAKAAVRVEKMQAKAAKAEAAALLKQAKADLKAAKAKVEAKEAAPPVPRLDTKQAQLIAMMRRPEGVTIDEAVERLDWQAHTVRGAIAGALKKKLGLDVLSERADGSRMTTYRIAG